MSGRIAIAASAVVLSKVGVLSAVRYSCARQQALRGGGHSVLWDHMTQRRALLGEVAKCYALGLGVNHTKKKYADMVLSSTQEQTPSRVAKNAETIRLVCAFKGTCVCVCVCYGVCRGRGIGS